MDPAAWQAGVAVAGDDSSITCSCGREYAREKAGTCMQRVVDADKASLAERRRELGDALDP